MCNSRSDPARAREGLPEAGASEMEGVETGSYPELGLAPKSGQSSCLGLLSAITFDDSDG